MVVEATCTRRPSLLLLRFIVLHGGYSTLFSREILPIAGIRFDLEGGHFSCITPCCCSSIRRSLSRVFATHVLHESRINGRRGTMRISTATRDHGQRRFCSTLHASPPTALICRGSPEMVVLSNSSYSKNEIESIHPSTSGCCCYD